MKRPRPWFIANLPLIAILTACAAAGLYLGLAQDGFSPPASTASDDPGVPLTEAGGKPTLGELRQYALGLVNEDRRKHGLAPVELGTNPAAQIHAEDMLARRYLGHWMADGRKPYMVYTETGGTSYASENAAVSSYAWWAADCEAGRRNCLKDDPYDAIRDAQYAMVYDDAHADWGHRDNILRASHRRVNIGVAVSDYFIAFVQHFEGGAITATEAPAITNGILHLKASINEPGLRVHDAVSVFYDPPPSPLSAAAIDATSTYCYGGGFTEACGERAFVVYPPAGPGLHYDLDADEVEADVWNVSATGFELKADIRRQTRRPGIYTVMVFGGADTGPHSGALLALTVNVP